MKQFFLIIVGLFAGLPAYAQNEFTFGVNGGFLLLIERDKFSGDDDISSEAGFYVGGSLDFHISEPFHIQTDLRFSYAQDRMFINLPIMWQYHLKNGIFIQAGPQVSYFIDDIIENFDRFGLDLSAGLGYQLMDNLRLDGRYSFEVTNRVSGSGDDVIRFRPVTIGVTYFFD